MRDCGLSGEPLRILVVALTRMGDLYETYPMVAALRERYPESRIYLVAYREFAPALGPLSLFAGVFPVDPKPFASLIRVREGPLEAYRAIRGWINELNALDADLLINLTPNRIGAILGYLIHAREKRGLHMTPDGYRAHYGNYVPYLGMLVKNRQYNNLNLSDLFLKIAGVRTPSSIPLGIPAFARESVGQKMDQDGISGENPVISFATGASQELKRWPSRLFANCIRDLLTRRSEVHVILLGAGEGDCRRNRAIRQEVCAENPTFGHRVHDWTQRTGTDELFAILDRSSVLVSNDTGTMHAAALLSTPVVCLSFANLFYPETGPWGAGNIVIYSKAPCAPCAPDSRCADPVCREDLDPRLVSRVVEIRMSVPREAVGEAIRSLRQNLESETVGGRSGIALSEEDASGDFRYRPLGRDSMSGEEFFRRVYERIWKKELEGMDIRENIPWESVEFLPDVLRHAARLRQMAEKGEKLVRKVAACMNNDSASVPEHLLQDLEGLDRGIEEAAWVCPPLGPLSLFFRLEKESIDIWNPFDLLDLVGKTEKTYQDLKRRVSLFTRVAEESAACTAGRRVEPKIPPCTPDEMSGKLLVERV